MKRKLRAGCLLTCLLLVLILLLMRQRAPRESWPPHPGQPMMESGPHDGRVGRKSYFRPKFQLTSQMIDKLSERHQLERQLLNTDHLLHLRNLTYAGHSRQLDCAATMRPGDSWRPQTGLLIVVNSKWSNFRRRQQVRSTWLAPASVLSELCRGGQVSSVEYLFAVGRAPDGELVLNAELERERSQHGDLVEVNLRDEYRALSLKHLAILKWILRRRREHLNRPSELLVLKCDDDAHVRLGPLLEFAVNVEQREEEDWLMCARFQHHSPVLRQPLRKWSLSRQEYPFDTFPAYCSGLAYLAPVRLLRRLLLLAHLQLMGDGGAYEAPLWVDDVFVTGILVASLAQPVRVHRLNAHFCYPNAGRPPHSQCLVVELTAAATALEASNQSFTIDTHLQ